MSFIQPFYVSTQQWKLFSALNSSSRLLNPYSSTFVVSAREKTLQGVEEKNWLEDTEISQSERNHVRWDKGIGLGPGAKLRVSVPGTDSEHHTQRFGARRLGRKTRKGRHTQSKSPNQELPVEMIPAAPKSRALPVSSEI